VSTAWRGKADAADVDGGAFEKVDAVLSGVRMRCSKLIFVRSLIASPFVIAGHEDGRLARRKRAHHADRFFQHVRPATTSTSKAARGGSNTTRSPGANRKAPTISRVLLLLFRPRRSPGGSLGDERRDRSAAVVLVQEAAPFPRRRTGEPVCAVS
jgi:hypothetical protein